MASEERLPCKVVEQMLPLLPVPDLYRFRSVCSPKFGTRCFQNATNGVTKGACFMVKLRHYIDSAKSGARRKEISSWRIFDLDTKRWLNVEETLLKGFNYHVSAMVTRYWWSPTSLGKACDYCRIHLSLSILKEPI